MLAACPRYPGEIPLIQGPHSALLQCKTLCPNNVSKRCCMASAHSYGDHGALLAAGWSQVLAASDPATAESHALVGWGLAEVWYKNLQLGLFFFPLPFFEDAAWLLVAECVLSKDRNWWAALVGCDWRGGWSICWRSGSVWKASVWLITECEESVSKG